MKQRKHYGKIWQCPIEEFKKIVKESSSLSQVLKHFKFATSHGNYRTLKRRLIEDEIDYSHIPLGKNSNSGRKFPSQKKPLSEVMVKNSTYDRQCLKKRLIKNGMLKNKCTICGQLPIWHGEKLVMVIDHINGDRYDNRRKTLRLLCPTCNSQTPTFSGRKVHVE